MNTIWKLRIATVLCFCLPIAFHFTDEQVRNIFDRADTQTLFTLREALGMDPEFSKKIVILGYDAPSAQMIGGNNMTAETSVDLLKKLERSDPSAIILDKRFSDPVFGKFEIPERLKPIIYSGAVIDQAITKSDVYDIREHEGIALNLDHKQKTPGFVSKRQLRNNNVIRAFHEKYRNDLFNPRLIDFDEYRWEVPAFSAVGETSIPHVGLILNDSFNVGDNFLKGSFGSKIYISEKGNIPVNFVSSRKIDSQLVSIWDVLKKDRTFEKGTIFIVAYQFLTGNADLHSTPTEAEYPGSYVIASVLNSDLHDGFIQKPSHALWFMIIVIMALALLLKKKLLGFWQFIGGSSLLVLIAVVAIVSPFMSASIQLPVYLPLISLLVLSSGFAAEKTELIRMEAEYRRAEALLSEAAAESANAKALAAEATAKSERSKAIVAEMRASKAKSELELAKREKIIETIRMRIIEDKLRDAKILQEKFRPKDKAFEINGYRIYWDIANAPYDVYMDNIDAKISQKVIGDYFARIKLDERESILLADAEGHGISGALIQVFALGIIQTYCKQAKGDVRGLIRNIEEQFWETFKGAGTTFSHFSLGDNGVIALINISTNTPFLVNGNTAKEVKGGKAKQSFIGAEKIEISAIEIPVEIGEAVMLTTDGYLKSSTVVRKFKEQLMKFDHPTFEDVLGCLKQFPDLKDDCSVVYIERIS